MIGLGLALPLIARLAQALGQPRPPAGYAWLRGADGGYLTGADGKRLYGRIS